MDRQYTYVASDNTSSNGTALGDDNQDIAIYQIHFGSPSDGTVTTIYDKINPYYGDTAGKVFEMTQATHAAGAEWVRVVDFGEKGLQMGEGGNIVTDASDVTVIWGVV